MEWWLAGWIGKEECLSVGTSRRGGCWSLREGEAPEQIHHKEQRAPTRYIIKGIQALRNNYNLLWGLPEFKNLSPQELINKLQVFGNIELTKDNVNFYMNKLGIKTNPFKERESWEFERFVKRL